jgi:hypothetical protein
MEKVLKDVCEVSQTLLAVWFILLHQEIPTEYIFVSALLFRLILLLNDLLTSAHLFISVISGKDIFYNLSFFYQMSKTFSTWIYLVDPCLHG